jgi:NAD(P)-dependent dehydrogenase (short-subunit alcohol dehydrogenase family)/glycerol uptake facilitator-like aquaporin
MLTLEQAAQPRVPSVPYVPVLEGQVAVVTGASSGIGRAVAVGFGRAGANVVVNYVGNGANGRGGGCEVVREIEAAGGRAIAVQADVSDEEDVRALFRAAINAFGTVHILVSNAGLQRDAALHEMTLDQWNHVLGVNLTGQFLCAREAVREFRRRGIQPEVSVAAGKIICMSSVHEVIPWAGHANYAASKGGVAMLMKSLAQELAPHRVRVNSIAPGAIRTPINTGAWSTPEAYERLLNLISYKRHRGAERHRPGGRLARLGRVRLRERRHAVRGRRHDPLPRLRGQRVMRRVPPIRTAIGVLRGHWPEYLLEAAGLGAVMLVSAAVTTAVEAPLLPAFAGLDAVSRRMIEGAAIAGTGIALVYSHLGRRSGAHFNPAVTLTFLLLGKVRPWDAAFYALAQVLGGLAGLLLAAVVLGTALGMAPVQWTATVPGPSGAGLAFLAEFLSAFFLMSIVLALGGFPRAARFTGFIAGLLSFVFITVEAPISGFSLNPARSLASALPSGLWMGFWIYVLAPPAGMALAALVNRRALTLPPMPCAKLLHDTATRCIHCGFEPARAAAHPQCEEVSHV